MRISVRASHKEECGRICIQLRRMLKLFAGLVLVCSALGERSIDHRQGSGGGPCSHDGEVKLQGGSHQFEGQVEICEDGEWAPICILLPGADWDVSHGEVVCRSLGYSTESVMTFTCDQQANSSHLHTTYKCNGSEQNLTECSTNVFAFKCMTVGQLICKVPKDERVCLVGDVQLVTNETVTTARGRGRVEVCSASGVWGTVCDEKWDDDDAKVVCRGLGFNGTHHEAVGNISRFGAGSGPILLTEVECNGDERNLTSCEKQVPSEQSMDACTHDEDAAVICSRESIENATECVLCQVHVQVGLAVSVSVLAVIVFIIVCLYIAHVLIMKRRKAQINAPSTAQYSDYISMYASSEHQQYEYLLKWKEELATYMIDSSLVDMEESLGEGCFGTVHKGVYHSASGDITVAIKTIKSVSDVEGFVSECVLMKDFDHRNVLGLVGVYLDDSTGLPLILLPYMSNGDLRTYLRSKCDFRHSSSVLDFPKDIDVTTLLGMCSDVTCGMEYLINNKFVHRDLAARNCMVDEDLTVKVADFGLSRDIYSKEYYRMTTKTLLPVKWMAPESLTDSIFTEKSDVWSFGVVCWEVFSLGSTPYPGVDNHEIPDYIAGGRRLKQPRLCPPDVYETMRLCWEDSPEQRPDFAHLAQVFDSMVHKYTVMSQHPHYVNVSNNHHSNTHQCNGNVNFML